MKIIVLLGRILYSAIFITGGINHLVNPQMVGYAASAGVPMPSLLVPLSGILALLGGLSVLFGYKARIGAWLIVAFLVPVTLMMHNFWVVTDPQMRMMQMVNFNKNVAMLGGAFMIAYFGSGPYSLESFWPLAGKTVRAHEMPMRKAA
jgi:putative oxidoreductase